MYFPGSSLVIDDYDVSILKGWVKRHLEPFYTKNSGEILRTIKSRSDLVSEGRHPTVGFRKMRPIGYVQFCLENDETPYSPWAMQLPEELSRSEVLLQEKKKIVERCREHYGPGQLVFFGFAILAPGGSIPSHRDMPHDINKKLYSHHLHLPLTGADDSEFTIGSDKLFLSEGKIYEINNIIKHSVENRGDESRVNLMVDYCPKANIWMRNSPSPDLQVIKIFYETIFKVKL